MGVSLAPRPVRSSVGAQVDSRWERSAAELPRAALREPLELHGRRRHPSTACRSPLGYRPDAAPNN